MRRIAVIGSGGSGKSRFAVALGERLGMLVIRSRRDASRGLAGV